MGTVKQDKSGWYYIYDAPRDANGERRQVRRRGFRTKNEATDALKIAEADALRGLAPSRERPTVETYLKDWLADQATRVTPKTIQGYRQIVERHLSPAFSGVLLINLSPAMIQRYYSARLADGLSAQTVLHHHRCLSAALEAALRLQLLHRNAARAVNPPRVPRREPRTLDPPQIHELLERLRGSDLYLPALLAACAGMRQAEILALRWGDLDLDRGLLRISGSLTESRDTPLERKSTKTNRGRTVALHPAIAEALKLERLSSGGAAGSYVCADALGGPVRPVIFSNRWRRRMAKLGVTITFHELRHSYATLALSLGIHPLVVAHVLGHSRVGTTLDVYSHVQAPMESDAAQRVGGAILAGEAKIPERDQNVTKNGDSEG